jgi:hypothetical protein
MISLSRAFHWTYASGSFAVSFFTEPYAPKTGF